MAVSVDPALEDPAPVAPGRHPSAGGSSTSRHVDSSAQHHPNRHHANQHDANQHDAVVLDLPLAPSVPPSLGAEERAKRDAEDRVADEAARARENN